MIKRDRYLQRLIDNRGTELPKVITGIRRCGKSYLLNEIYRRYLIEDGIDKESILMIALDDDSHMSLRNPVALGEYVRRYCKGKSECYVFLDEIQLVDTIINPAYTDGNIVIAAADDKNTISFVEVILGLSREKNIDLYVTGSNSKMLSSDIVTEFRDKAVNIHIGPLSFEEFYTYRGGSGTDAIYEYMQYGGMPLAVDKDRVGKQEYLKGLFKTTYFKDILERNSLKKTEAMDELCNIISECTGTLINSEKIANTYKSNKKESIDKSTVERYLSFFEDAYIIREAKRYDIKGRKEIGARRKYYFADTGLRNARLDFAFPDEGLLIENIIYNELIYHRYLVSIGTYDSIEKNSENKSIKKTYEIDFYAVRGERRYYIQVCADATSISTMKRELRPYKKLHDNIKKILVVNKPIDETHDDDGFTIIGTVDFLLRYIV